MVDDLFRRKILQIELQATRKHRHRKLLGVGGREQKLHMFRRFFKGLKHRVETVTRQHMDFVDQVYLESADSRHVLNVIEQFAHIIDTCP